MKRKWRLFIPLAAAVAAAGLLPPPAQAQSDLSRYRHKNRLLLVFAPSKTDRRWQAQNTLLAHSEVSFRDRDLRRFDYFGSQNSAVRQRYGIKPNQFQVLLLGKDGHVAFRSPTPVALSDLTGQIDKMPMRRDEMRRRGRSQWKG